MELFVLIFGVDHWRAAYPFATINVQKQCKAQGSAFFFKQWGTWGADGVKRNKKVNGRTLVGRTFNEYPIALELLRGHHERRAS